MVKIWNIFPSVVNLLSSTYTEIHIKQNFTLTTYHSECRHNLVDLKWHEMTWALRNVSFIQECNQDATSWQPVKWSTLLQRDLCSADCNCNMLLASLCQWRTWTWLQSDHNSLETGCFPLRDLCNSFDMKSGYLEAEGIVCSISRRPVGLQLFPLKSIQCNHWATTDFSQSQGGRSPISSLVWLDK